MHPDVHAYNASQADADRAICTLLADIIDQALPEAENKIWHRHPVWFLAEVFIDFIRNNKYLGMFSENFCQSRQFIFCINRAAGITGRREYK